MMPTLIFSALVNPVAVILSHMQEAFLTNWKTGKTWKLAIEF